MSMVSRRKEVSNMRAKATRRYRHRRPRLRLFDPFSWLEWLTDKGLLTLERAVRKRVEAVMR